MKKYFIIATTLIVAGCSQTQTDQTLENTIELDTTQEEVAVTELQIEDLQEGSGDEAKEGDTVEVHYTGWLTDGTKFDSSVDRGTPFSFALGAGEVIQGWDEGVAGMKIGGKRKLTIPADKAYGQNGVGPIPPNATLVFEVELLDIVQ